MGRSYLEIDPKSIAGPSFNVPALAGAEGRSSVGLLRKILRTASDSSKLYYGISAVQNDFGPFCTVRNANTVDARPAALLRTARLARE